MVIWVSFISTVTASSKDYAEARKWYEKAAAAGNAFAMNGLGLIYLNGYGVALDYVEARKWYEKAAATGNAYAMYNLGNPYLNGDGAPKDYAEARKWYEKARRRRHAPRHE